MPRIAFFAASNGFAIFGRSDVSTFASAALLPRPDVLLNPRGFLREVKDHL
ncbi:MAG: hypothetical protein ACJ790_15740 [Myxococcaceae bacterium]